MLCPAKCAIVIYVYFIHSKISGSRFCDFLSRCSWWLCFQGSVWVVCEAAAVIKTPLLSLLQDITLSLCYFVCISHFCCHHGVCRVWNQISSSPPLLLGILLYKTRKKNFWLRLVYIWCLLICQFQYNFLSVMYNLLSTLLYIEEKQQYPNRITTS